MTLPDRALRIGRVVGTVEKHGDVVSITNTGLDLPRSHLRVDGNVRGVGAATDLEFKVSSGAFAFDEMARLIPWVPARPVQAELQRQRARAAVEAGDDDRVPIAGRGRRRRRRRRPRGGRPGAAAGVPRHARSRAHRSRRVEQHARRGGPRHRARGVHLRAPGRQPWPAGARDVHDDAHDASVAGYEARGAEARGRFDGPRVTLQRARGQAYGGRFDARGTIGPRDPGEKGVRFDLTGRVDDIDVRRLPPPVPRLRLATDVAGTFHATLDGPQFDATMTFDDSIVEGGRVRAGSIGTFALAPGVIRYGAKARLEALDLGRLGAALDVAWLQDPRVAGPMTGDVDVQAQGRTLGGPVAERARGAGPRHRRRRRRDGDDPGRADRESPARRGHRRRRRARRSGGRDDRRLGRGRRVRPRQGPRVDSSTSARAPTAEAFGFDGDVTLGPSRVAGRDITVGVDVAPARRRRARRPPSRGRDAARRGHRVRAAGAEHDRAIRPGLHDPRHPAGPVPRADRRGDGHGRCRRPAARAARHAADRRHGALCRRRGGRRAGPRGHVAVQRRRCPTGTSTRARLDVHPVLSAGAVGDTVLDAADARVGYRDERATFASTRRAAIDACTPPAPPSSPRRASAASR